MNRFFPHLTFFVICLALAHCAPSSSTQISTPTTVASPTTEPPNHRTTEPPNHRTTEPPNHRTTEPPNHRTTEPPNHQTTEPPTMQTQLVIALELAANEMRAAQNSATLDESRAHAEAVVNILVGKRGRWYGDQDGDGTVNDPLNGRGVLPGEIQTQGADLDNAVNFSAGLALMAAGTDPNPPPLTVLLGDVKLWRGQPRAGYDQIANALANANASSQLNTLQGNVPRVVAYARLMLTNARTVEEARALAAYAGMELERAMEAARTIPP